MPEMDGKPAVRPVYYPEEYFSRFEISRKNNN